MRTGKQSGFTMVEAMIAVFLLSLTAVGYIYAMMQGQRVAGMSSQQLTAMHIARDVIEQVRAQDYADIQNIPATQVDQTFTYQCTVSASGFTDTKNILVVVSWQDVASTTLSTVELTSSACRWLHQ